MSEPKSWTRAELTNDAEASRALLRKQRLDEPLALYSEFFNNFVPISHRIIVWKYTMCKVHTGPP